MILMLLILLVKLIGVNKGRRVTLKYLNILIKINKEHSYYIYSIPNTYIDTERVIHQILVVFILLAVYSLLLTSDVRN